MRVVAAFAFCVLCFLPFAARADYNIDGSKWHQTGLGDAHFTSILYSHDWLDQPVDVDCSVATPFDDDGNPATIGMTIDVGALSGGQIQLTSHPTGTLNVVTGAWTASETKSGLSIPFQVTIPSVGTYTLVLTQYTQTAVGTVTGHDSIFVNGQWRDPGTAITSDSTQTIGTYKGYIDIIFKPSWTLVVNNARTTSTICERPGVTISGTLTLDWYRPSPAGIQAAVIVRNTSQREDATATLDDAGAYAVVTHIPGQVDVLAKGTHWLRAIVPGVSTMAGSVSGVDMELVNGDENDSNTVTLTDLGMVLLDFGSTDNSPADMDGSGVVSLTDLGMVLLNFGAVGAS
jgi:hypothetical protein